MLIYMFIIAGMILLGIVLKPNNNLKNRKIYIFIVFGLLIIIAAIRSYTIGTDTEQYTGSYKVIRSIDFAKHNTIRFEIGFFTMCKILNYFSEDPQILLIITSLIIFGAMGFFVYENSEDVIMSSILFVTLNYYGLFLSAMRQALAIGIIAFSLRYLYEKKYIKYFLGILVASLFHQTAIIMVVLIFFRNIKFFKKYLYIDILIAIVAFMFANKLFGVIVKFFTVYESYSKSSFFESNYFAALLNSVVSFVILITGIFCYELSNGEKYKEYDFNAFIMSISFILYVVTMKINIFSRATMYFSIFTIVWLPNSINSIDNAKQRMVLKYCVFIFSMLYWIVIAKYRPEWHSVVPYQTFF